jgi:hypothetical protein
MGVDLAEEGSEVDVVFSWGKIRFGLGEWVFFRRREECSCKCRFSSAD